VKVESRLLPILAPATSGMIEANARLPASAGWYEGVRKSYLAGR
jgi:hypothetical protein